MKKIYILPLLLLTLFVRVNKVNAITSNNWYISDFYTYNNAYADYVSLDENNSPIISNLISYYNSNWSTIYDYYYIIKTSISGVSSYAIFPSNSEFLTAFNSSNIHLYRPYPGDGYNTALCYYYNINSNTYNYSTSCSNNWYNILYSSNTTPKFKIDTNFSYPATSLQLPSWSDLSLDVSYPLMDIDENDVIPTYMSLTNGQPSADFTEVDMSQYDYIILSLRDYDTTTFNTTIYSQGRLCFTPVYDYGMRQKETYYSGYKTKACTEYYTSLTPVPIYIIQADIDNHAVYYIKRYENETNILKIPTSIFDITYITSQNASDPQVEIGGRSYPVIPYNQLTDTANISTSQGYISGQVCPLGDVNCEYENGIGLDISDIFTQPLKVLQSVWASITTVFALITEFIMLIPSPLREFLIASFMLAIILGILKIIL